MSFNKRILSKAVSQLDKAKAPKKPQDIIKDPRGQWAHPGENTRIPGNDITMDNVTYPVWAQPNVGPGMMMQPGQNYTFPGADYVDEFPQVQEGSKYIELELTDEQIAEYQRGGYIVEELPQAQGGGASYADSLAAYNYGRNIFIEYAGEEYANKNYESEGEKINKYWDTEEGKEDLEWMKSQDIIPPGVDKFKVKPVNYGTESSFGQVFYKKPTKPRTKTYEDVYKNVDKKKYPTLESFIVDAKFWDVNQRNMTDQERAEAQAGTYQKDVSGIPVDPPGPVQQPVTQPVTQSGNNVVEPGSTLQWVQNPDTKTWSQIQRPAAGPTKKLNTGAYQDGGEDKEAALAFGMGSWKDQLPEHLQDKQTGGVFNQAAYSDSLNLYKAYKMQDKLMGPGSTPYERDDSDWSTEALRDARIPRMVPGSPTPVVRDFQSEEEQFKNGFNPWWAREEDQELIDYYRSLGFGDDQIMFHSSPDIASDTIKPIGTYNDGTAASPIYKKPVMTKAMWEAAQTPFLPPRKLEEVPTEEKELALYTHEKSKSKSKDLGDLVSSLTSDGRVVINNLTTGGSMGLYDTPEQAQVAMLEFYTDGYNVMDIPGSAMRETGDSINKLYDVAESQSPWMKNQQQMINQQAINKIKQSQQQNNNAQSNYEKLKKLKRYTFAEGGESKCPEGMVPDGKGGCIEISSVFNEQEEFEKTLPKTEPKYYDKEGNLLETVPDYGTIYVTGKDDPKYKEYQDRLKFYNKAKKLHNDEGIKEWTREVASMKKLYDSQKNNPTDWSADEISHSKKLYEDWKEAKELYTDYRRDYKSERYTSQLPTIDWNEVTFKKDYGTHFADRWNFGLKEGIHSAGDDGYDQVDKKWGALLNEALKTTVRPTKYFRGEGHLKPVFTYPSLNVKVLDEALLKEKSPSTPTTLKAQDPDEIYGEHSFRTGNRVVNGVLTPAEPESTSLPTKPLVKKSTPGTVVPPAMELKWFKSKAGTWYQDYVPTQGKEYNLNTSSYLQNGGSTPVSDPSDPRLHAYIDSSNLYKGYEKALELFPNIKGKFIDEKDYYDPNFSDPNTTYHETFQDYVNQKKQTNAIIASKYTNAAGDIDFDAAKLNPDMITLGWTVPTTGFKTIEDLRKYDANSGKLADFYNQMSFREPANIGYWYSPDMGHSSIEPSGSYYGGAWNPVYEKPVSPYHYTGDSADVEALRSPAAISGVNTWQGKKAKSKGTTDPNISVAVRFKNMGINSSFKNRKKVAMEEMGMEEEYSGTPKQNKALNLWVQENYTDEGERIKAEVPIEEAPVTPIATEEVLNGPVLRKLKQEDPVPPGTVVPPASTLQWVKDPRTNKWHQIQRPVKSEDLESRKIGFLQEGGQLNEELELSDMEKVKLERLGYVFEKI